MPIKKSHFNAAAIGAAITLVFAGQGTFAADTATKTSAAASAAVQNGAAAKPSAGAQASASAATTSLNRSDRQFIEKAAIGSMMEVELGKLAQQRASNPQVKAFGERMVQDHGKAVDEIRQLASDKAVKVPAQLDASHRKTVEKFNKAKDADFDRRYAGEMVKDHKKDISTFEKASKGAKDPQVRQFAEKTLPTLREHLKMAQNAQASVRKSSN